MKIRTVAILVACLAAVSFTSLAQPTSVPQAQQQNWINWVIPLPKEITIPNMILLTPDQVKLQLSPNPSDLEKNAAKLITDHIMANSHISTTLTGSDFTIRMGLINDQGMLGEINLAKEADRLKALPNSKQAYIITPQGDNMLILAALNEQGLYYAAQTFKQMLEPAFQKHKIAIPLATVTDWPDIEQRGYWEEGFSPAQLDKLAALKYNTLDVRAKIGFDKDCHPTASMTPKNMWSKADGDFTTACYNHAIKCVPYIVHLSHLKRTGIYDCYPDVMGKGDTARTKNQKSWRAPCSSNPKFIQILADWISQLADNPLVDEVSVWMAEDYVSCSCPKCKAKGEYVAESLAVTKAWEIAKQKHPDLKMHLLLTQGSYSTNDKVFAATPKDMRIAFYDGGRSYDSSKQPMIYPLLENYAASGRWLGVYPQITVSWAFVLPWSCPQFMKARMAEYTDKKLHEMIGYAHPDIDVYDFNFTAGAEWTWNAHGRNEHQFTLAWATRRGFSNPQRVAEWTDTLGPASWNLYGSSFPYKLLWVDPGNLIRMRMKPRWGTNIFRYFSGPDDLDKNIADVDRALDIAKEIGDQDFIDETIIVRNYYNILKAITQMMTFNAEHSTLSDAQKEKMKQYDSDMHQALKNIAQVLPEWGARQGLNSRRGRISSTIKDTRKIVDKITAAVDKITK